MVLLNTSCRFKDVHKKEKKKVEKNLIIIMIRGKVAIPASSVNEQFEVQAIIEKLVMKYIYILS